MSLRTTCLFKYPEVDMQVQKAITYQILQERMDTDDRGVRTFAEKYTDAHSSGVKALIIGPPKRSVLRKRRVLLVTGRAKRQRAGSGSRSGSESASEDDDDYVKAVRVDDDDDASGPSEDGKEAAL